MNPQKYSQHTALNHSLLWRKSYSFEKPIKQFKTTCHQQLNQLGQTGISWRTRNNMIQTNFSSVNINKSDKQNLKKSYSSFRVNKILKDSKNQTEQTKSLKKSLVVNTDVLEKSSKLISAMEILKDMKLLSNKDLQKIKYPGVIRHEHIYNDYHERVTNPGFSRNHAGKHFAK